VGDRPFLQLIIERLKAAGCDEITLATGYLSELVEAFCGDGSKFGVKVHYLKEGRPLGTAGPLWRMRGRVARDEHFVLMNGDINTKLDFGELLRFARRRDYDLTVGYVRHTYRSPYGVLTIDGAGEIKGIVEKPEIHQSISGGIYVLKGAALDHIPEDEFFTVPDLIQKLQACDRPVGAFHIEDFWQGVEELGHIEKAREGLTDPQGGQAAAARAGHDVGAAR
jgi:NDP-sugar pyrophosphorylase family protein